MRKQLKNDVLSPRNLNNPRQSDGKFSLRTPHADKHALQKQRGRAMGDIMSPANKENQQRKANLQSDPLSPLSPLQRSPATSQYLKSFNSPPRTTPLEGFGALLSNKGKEDIKEGCKKSIVYSGFSKDGKYKVESVCLEGEDLLKACDYEKKVNLANRLQSKRYALDQKIPVIESAKISHKDNGFVKSYAVNTHQGIVRNYNEDRVSITLNIKKKGVRAQFFAIYDGHGGHLCCDYLKDNLHQLLINSSSFPSDPKKALSQAINQTEISFNLNVKENKKKGGNLDRSGSCAIAALMVEDVCYVANVGDSRAIMSTEGGKLAFNLSKDHRPSDTREQKRVFLSGGKIYRTEMVRLDNTKEKVVGPLRILPGKLSVSRTIGDIEAKDAEFGGLSGVVGTEADIRKFRLTGKEDFVILCCDGILERMESMEAVEVVWRSMNGQGSLHERTGKAVDGLLQESMRRKSSDNLTAIVFCLREIGQKQYMSPRKMQSKSP